MTRIGRCLLAASALMIGAALLGCSEREKGPAERAGEKVDGALDRLKKKVRDAADD